MSKPISSAIGDKSFLVLAKQLIDAHSAACQPLHVKADGIQKPMKVNSLATKIGDLDAGKSLSWWSKKPELTKCLVDLIGINHDDLALDKKQGPHVFKFVDAPDLPSLDLRRQDHWIIAKPKFVPKACTNCNFDYSTRAAMGYWLSENNSFPHTSKIEWLHVQDDLEFELLVRRLKVLGNHDILSCKTLKDVVSHDESASHLLNQKPLIISVEKDTIAEDLHKLIDDRNKAPLLVISRCALPAVGNEKAEKNYREEINCWDWVLLENWRELLLNWCDQRLNDHEHSRFLSQPVKEWLVEHDSNYQWFPSTRDVLQLCQLVSKNSSDIFKTIPNGRLGMGLLETLFKPEESGRDLVKLLIEARWKRWDMALEGYLPLESWKKLSEGICDYDKLRTNNLVTSNRDGLNFKHPMVVRLILRDLLIQQIAQVPTDKLKKPVQEWVSACFDSERRPLVDAALDASSIDILVRVAHYLEQEQDTMVVIGVAEALFTAIGRRIARGLNKDGIIINLIPEKMQRLIINGVFAGLDLSQGLARPWSRPLNSKSEEIEWVSSCWAWSLLPLPKGISAPNTWLFPGWSDQLPDHLPEWLVPRASFKWDGSLDHIDYAQNRNFIAVVEQWLCIRNGVSKAKTLGHLPMFLKIGLLRQAAIGAWKVETEWWYGVIETPWAEAAVLWDLKSTYNDGLKTTAMNWWPSLVAYIQYRCEHEIDGVTYCNQLASKTASEFSKVFQWVMEQLKADCSKAFEQLSEKTLGFLGGTPQLLNKSFKLELLKSLAQRLPSSDWMLPWQASGYFRNFGADAVGGIDAFLHDEQLGEQAALNLWSWAPDRAKNLLCYDETIAIKAKQNLIKKCPPDSVAAAIESLQRDKNILNSGELKSWVQLHLPNARNHVADLLGLIPFLYTGGDKQGLLH